jgi:DUF1680 family protein
MLRKTCYLQTGMLFTLCLSFATGLNCFAKAGPDLVAPPKAAPFRLDEVRLLEGTFKDAQDIAVQYLLSLEPDRFLANFRKEAGLKPKAGHYGGWESQGVSGHNGGHYLGACAQAYAATGDKRFLERVNYMVSELAECQKANGNGYVAAIPGGKKIYEEVAAGNVRSAGFDLNGGWVPNYTMHKVFAGLRDAYRLCDCKQALEVARQLADWYERVHAGLTDDQMQRIMAAEFGGLNETFADLYADTGEVRYLNLARRFHHKSIIDPLSKREDILPGKHANTQIPKLIGHARLYELTGKPEDRAAAEFFWDRVVNHHSYITGGHCDHEHFGEPDRLNDRLSDDTTETCNVYNMLKLTTHVFGWDPSEAKAAFYERALLNHVRGTQHPDGRVIYNLTLRPGGTKNYQTLFDSFTCCVGTGMENHVRYGEGIYFHDDKGVWINLFIPSELNWAERGLKLRQETSWPYEEKSTIRVISPSSQPLELRVRYPRWADRAFTLRINGKPMTIKAVPGSYVTVERAWKAGDKLEIEFPMSLRTESMPDNPKRLGVFYGPVLLAANLGPSDDPKASAPDFVPVLVTEGKGPEDWLKPIPGAQLSFRTRGVGKPREVSLEPFFAMHDRRYTVFFDTFTAPEWEQREARLLAEREQEAKLAARTVDELRIGEQQPEKDHNLQGENTSTGTFNGRKWRHAVDGGWFSFDLKVQPGKTNELVLTYWGGENGNRTFDVLVENTRVGTQKLLMNQPGKFFEVTYTIPPSLVAGKSQVNIRLQAHPGAWAGGLYGARSLRAEQDKAGETGQGPR